MGSGGSHHIFLGDVVVSDEIVVYDFGKRLPGQFVYKDTIDNYFGSPSTEVRAFLNKLKSRRGRQQLVKRASYYLAALQESANDHRYPGTCHDRLFELNYHHRHHDACKTCSRDWTCERAQAATCAELRCDESRLVARPSRIDDINSPGTEQASLRVHFGRMASGDTVMKSGDDRDSIALHQGVLAFEMEGAGVLSSLPCIIVKGVSDYADSHKDKIWQNYAAGSAAAFMKALLEQWAITDRFYSGDTDTLEEARLAASSARSRESTDALSSSSRSSSGLFDVPNALSSQSSDQTANQDNSSRNSQLPAVLPRIETSFKSAIACLKEFRKFLPRDVDLKTMLRIQRDIFRTSIESILSQAKLPSEVTRSMVLDANNPMWNDEPLQDRILYHLGQSADALIKVAQDIYDALTRLESLTRRLKASSKRKVPDIQTKPAVTPLKEALQGLKLLIQKFSFLVPLRREAPSLGESPPQATMKRPQELEGIDIIRQAAASLCHMIKTACDNHETHFVHLTMQPDLDERMARVRFNVAFFAEVEGSKSSSQPVWIDIESTIKSSMTRNSRIAAVPAGDLDPPKMQQSGDEEISSETKRVNKHVHFSLSSEAKHIEPGDTAYNILDLCSNGDFCKTVRQPSADLDKRIGLLADGDVCRHVLYASKQSHTPNDACASLAQLVSSSASDLTNGLSLYKRIRLAKYLAAAVLYYHSTMWLDKAWYSDNVYFFTKRDGGRDGVLRQSAETLPYMRASVKTSSSLSQPSDRCTESEEFIRNPVLFSLGIMFLELAYQAPLSALQRSLDYATGKSPGLVRFSTARRLAENVHSVISIGFRAIVEKCLYCDFGHGSNFKSSALQQAFHREVMGGLDKIESVFKQLQHDDPI